MFKESNVKSQKLSPFVKMVEKHEDVPTNVFVIRY